jgi:hypothetical protein
MVSLLFESIRNERLERERITATLGLKRCFFGADNPGDLSIALELYNCR